MAGRAQAGRGDALIDPAGRSVGWRHGRARREGRAVPRPAPGEPPPPAAERLGRRFRTTAGVARVRGDRDDEQWVRGDVGPPRPHRHPRRGARPRRGSRGAVEVPVAADTENGYAHDPAGVATTVALACETGLAGCSIEDFTGRAADPIYDLGLAADRVAAAVDAAHRGPTHLVLTARAENLIHGRDDLADTIMRLQAYQDAGADVLFAPGLATRDDVHAVVSSVDRPVNVLVRPGLPPVDELASLGVARISVGGAFTYAALAGLVDAATELRDRGTYGYWDRVGARRATRSSARSLMERSDATAESLTWWRATRPATAPRRHHRAPGARGLPRRRTRSGTSLRSSRDDRASVRRGARAPTSGCAHDQCHLERGGGQTHPHSPQPASGGAEAGRDRRHLLLEGVEELEAALRSSRRVDGHAGAAEGVEVAQDRPRRDLQTTRQLGRGHASAVVEQEQQLQQSSGSHPPPTSSSPPPDRAIHDTWCHL